jgi:hypothetical protein
MAHEPGFNIDDICGKSIGLIERRTVMTEPVTALPGMVKRIGVAADHGGFELKQELAGMLRQAGYEVRDYGNSQPEPEDDYPDYVVPLARAVASGKVDSRLRQWSRGVRRC